MDPADRFKSERIGYDTRLTPGEEEQFRAWAEAQSRRLGRPVLRDIEDYDLRGLFKQIRGGDLEPGHFTDQFKKPNHPTFSTQSQYSGRGSMVGGEWTADPQEKWSFQASPHNVESRGAEGLVRYFMEREPDAKLILPKKP